MPEISVRNVPVKKVGGQISFPIIKIHLFEIEVEIKNLGVILYRRQLRKVRISGEILLS